MKGKEINEMVHRIREQLAAEYKPRTNEEMEDAAREFAAACGLKLNGSLKGAD